MNILKLSHIISKFLFLAKQAAVDVYAPKSAVEARAILDISQQDVLTKELLSKKYKQSVLKNHPDLGADPVLLKKINAAKDYLLKYVTKEISYEPDLYESWQNEYYEDHRDEYNDESDEPENKYRNPAGRLYNLKRKPYSKIDKLTGNLLFESIKIGDINISIQAGYGKYSDPRQNTFSNGEVLEAKDYDSFEVALFEDGKFINPNNHPRIIKGSWAKYWDGSDPVAAYVPYADVEKMIEDIEKSYEKPLESSEEKPELLD